jgi:hypothetical protein
MQKIKMSFLIHFSTTKGIKNKENDLIYSVGETPKRKEYASFQKSM